MEIKGTLLEANGTEITGIDDALFNRFLTNFQDGIIKGAYEEAKFSILNSNTLHIGKGVVLISGMRVIIESISQSFAIFPKASTRYQIVLQIQMDETWQPHFTSIIRQIEALKKEDILNKKLINPVYQVELGRFSLNQDGIEDATTTLDVIVAGKDSVSQEINIGNVTANKIDISLQPEVDIDNRFDEKTQKYFVDFNFNLPVNIQKETIDKIDLSLSNSEEAMLAVQQFKEMQAAFAETQEQLKSMQEQIATLHQDKEESKLLAYPIGSKYFSENIDFNPEAEFGGKWEEIESPITNFERVYSTIRVSDKLGSDFHNIKRFTAEYDGSITIAGQTSEGYNNTISISRKLQGANGNQIERSIIDGVGGPGWASSAQMVFLKGDVIEFTIRNINVNYDLCTILYYNDNIIRSGKVWKRVK